ncbi:MAG: hypothetical protein D6788_03060, partial [Planctomycetota bacterium]
MRRADPAQDPNDRRFPVRPRGGRHGASAVCGWGLLTGIVAGIAFGGVGPAEPTPTAPEASIETSDSRESAPSARREPPPVAEPSQGS